jgi:ribonuclease E
VRDDGRPVDAYAWVHAHPSRRPNPSEDPYAWRDPHAPNASREDRLIETRAERIGVAAAEAPGPSALAPLPGPQTVVEPGAEADPYVWSATPDDGGDEVVTGRRRERVRRGRGRRGRGTERGDIATASEDAESPAPEAEADATPDAFEPEVEPAPTAPAPLESAPETVAEEVLATVDEALFVEPQPQPEPEPDPNEITTPPATPRRGWWRRGG